MDDAPSSSGASRIVPAVGRHTPELDVPKSRPQPFMRMAAHRRCLQSPPRTLSCSTSLIADALRCSDSLATVLCGSEEWNKEIAMIKVSVMYANKPGARFDHVYYRDKHMPLVRDRMGPSCLFY